MRPADLAREHGISTQAVRNYEQDGFLPPASRTPSGYRIYTDVHASALRAFLALVPAYGHATAGGIMTAVHDDDLGRALTLVDRGHEQLLRDRETLNAVRKAIGHLTTGTAPEPTATGWSIGELAHRLDVTAATIRAWERAGILVPRRNPATGYRVFTAADIRDAELTHLLRRGGYPLEHIATVVEQVRTAGGTESLVDALETWQEKLNARGVAMLDAAGLLGAYLRSRP
ncbi:TioE family transcriptional regulator [Amycolatopsis sp. MEPSY49]|uniref:TioE family transcriptional regulator n=1 Tax=Amycolatopsis sp. MEPSY49 TaxID=3151600 RepID=UPI003EF2FEC4